MNHEYYPLHCLCTLDLHRKMWAVQEFWNSTQIQKGKKKMKTNQKTSSEPQEAKCICRLLSRINRANISVSERERGEKVENLDWNSLYLHKLVVVFYRMAKNRFVCVITFLMHKLVLFMNWWWDLFSNLKNKNISLYFLILFAF